MAAGCKAFTVYNHMLLPTVFESMEADYRHLLEHVQVWDVSCERQVELLGPDALTLAQMMTPRNLAPCEIGQCVYAPTVDENGGMTNDPVILKLAQDRYWVSVADSDVVLWAHGLAVGRRLDVKVFEPDVSPLAVQGPKAFDLVARVFGEQMRALRFFRFVTVPWEGLDMLIARSGWSKQGGVEIYLPDARLGHRLWDTLMEAGEDLQVRAGCPNVIERIESGLLSYGSDMTREHNPYECGLEKYCDIPATGEVLCREALAGQSEATQSRRIVSVRLPGEPVPPAACRWPVSSGGKSAGHVSSAVYSPRLKHNVGLAMLDTQILAGAGDMQVQLPDGSTRRVRPVTLPFD